MTSKIVNSPLKLEYVKTVGMINATATGRGFFNPYSIALSSDNRIFVLERGGMSLSRINVCTYEEEHIGEFATWYGDGPGDKLLQQPSDIAFDSDDRLYVTNETNHQILVYDSSNTYHGSWGTYGDGEGEFNSPSGIAIDNDDHIYVVDQHNHRLQKFTTDGDFLTEWGVFGNSAGQFNMPWGVAIDTHGYVYVVDWRNDRIQKFTPEGDFVSEFGESGHDDGQLYRPSSIAIDQQGHMYVADWGNERVQIFGPEGEFLQNLRGESNSLTKWTEGFFESNPDERNPRSEANLFPDLPPNLQDPYHISSQTEPYFWGISFVILDWEDRLYVCEYRRHRFQVYQKV